MDDIRSIVIGHLFKASRFIKSSGGRPTFRRVGRKKVYDYYTVKDPVILRLVGMAKSKDMLVLVGRKGLTSPLRCVRMNDTEEIKL